MKSLFPFLFVFICFTAFSQTDSTTEIPDVPFAVIDQVPIYPGCTQSTNAGLKKCMSDAIEKHVLKNFNMKIVESTGNYGKQRAHVRFQIDKKGRVTNIEARASTPEVETEIIRVIKSLPQLTPGKQRGKVVGVLYALPIIYNVEKPSKHQKKGVKGKS